MAPATRNRLFDVIATLFYKGEKVDRPLVWTQALLRDISLYKELSLHTQRDLRLAIKKLSDEPSPRGLLSTLLLQKMVAVAE